MKKFLTILIWGLWAVSPLQAQDKAPSSGSGSISGLVLDAADDQPLIGVSILLKGTTRGVITDLDGRFEIKRVDAGNATLVFDYVGYLNYEAEANVVDGKTTELGEIKLEPEEVGLKEVEVFADVVVDRKTPVASSAITNKVMDEQFVGMELPEMVNAMPGMYSTQGAGGYGDNEVFVRGFGQSEIAFLVNGIPVNDMENGRMYWSNFAGLSEVTRRMEIQRGLGATKLAVSAIGGTINMITKPSDKRPGGRIDYMFGNITWNQRIRFTLNTGKLDNGWAFTFQGSKTNSSGLLRGMDATQGGGYRPGAFVDAYSYYFAASKQIGRNHNILFSAFGAPVNRGTAWNTTREEYERYDNYFHNIAAGYYRGEFLNGRQNRSHKPQISLSHFWNINSKLSLNTSVYTSFARVYSTQPRGHNSDEDYTNDGFFDWDKMAQENINNVVTVANPNGDPFAGPIIGARSTKYIEARFNNHDWYGMISTLDYDITPNLNLVAGVDLRTYRAEHYAEVFHLLGGDFVLDKFGNFDNNMLKPNNVARLGDRINYDYDGNVRWGAIFAQAEYSLGKFNFFTSLTGSSISLWRYGNFWNGTAAENSFGKSEVKTFNNYNVRVGGNYRFNNRHNVFLNAGNFNRAPFLSSAFQDSRYNNTVLQGLSSEKVVAAEIGYGYRSPRLNVNVNFYLSEWRDRTFSDFITDADGNRVYFAIPGQDARHQGFELDTRFMLTSSLELTGMVSIGDWRWKNNVTAFVNTENSQTTAQINVYADGLPVGNAAQTVIFGGLHYRGIKDMYIGMRVNHFDRLWIRFDPADVRNPNPEGPLRLPSYEYVDLYFGRYFRLSDKIRGRASANINNVFNVRAVRYATEFQGEVTEGYGFMRNFIANLSIYF